jgi:hypothetical protein
MKKVIHEWAFNLFTKRITIKVSKLPNDERIEYLLNKLMNELVSQGHDISGSSKEVEFFAVFGHQGKTVTISPNNCPEINVKRLTNI